MCFEKRPAPTQRPRIIILFLNTQVLRLNKMEFKCRARSEKVEI